MTGEQRTIRLLLAYDGTDFHGWARQRDPSIRTVEGVVSEALDRVLGESPRLSVAGRTDAGVHARGQVVSFSTNVPIPPGRLADALNGSLAPEVVVRDARFAPEGFDARFSASAREYRYVIATDEIADPFRARYEWHRPGDLSLVRVRSAARALLGEHDFASFCRREGDRPLARELSRLSVVTGGGRVAFTVRANAFCHQMVRSLVGTLVLVGESRIEPRDIPSILAARDRARAGPVAPARGLTLERVVYGRRAP